MSEPRTCAYCGSTSCRCKYRYGRMGELAMSLSNVTEQTTMAEARKWFDETFGGFGPETKIAFLFSVTKLDPKSLAKRKAKALGKAERTTP